MDSRGLLFAVKNLTQHIYTYKKKKVKCAKQEEGADLKIPVIIREQRTEMSQVNGNIFPLSNE